MANPQSTVHLTGYDPNLWPFVLVRGGELESHSATRLKLMTSVLSPR
jgi:hypothetical protein